MSNLPHGCQWRGLPELVLRAGSLVTGYHQSVGWISVILTGEMFVFAILLYPVRAPFVAMRRFQYVVHEQSGVAIRRCHQFYVKLDPQPFHYVDNLRFIIA